MPGVKYATNDYSSSRAGTGAKCRRKNYAAAISKRGAWMKILKVKLKTEH